MYEAMTYETVLKQMLERVPNTVDKREGSIIFDALAPAAAELAQMYTELDTVLNETFAEGASRQYLIKRAAERGLSPYKATAAIAKGVFNVPVDIGSRFVIEKYHYRVVGVISNTAHSYRMVCETEGEEPNYTLGTLIPVEYIKGLERAELTEILTPGEEEEPTEDFRKRYFDSFDNQAFGGNRADYKSKISAVQGVGGVKIYRAWKGGGTVKCVILNSAYEKPSDSLVGDIQTAIDPEINQGDGVGLAPIGHIVTITGVEETPVNIESKITYKSGWSFEDARPYIEEAVNQYLRELCRAWQDSETIIVRISQMESRLLELECIEDIADTLLNGKAENLIIETDSIPVRGEIIG